MDGSFGDPSTQLLTASFCQIVSSELKTGFPFHPGRSRTTPVLLWSQTSPTHVVEIPVFPDERHRDGRCLWFVSLCIASAFIVDLYVGLPRTPRRSRTKGDLTGQVTSHFPKATTPNTMAFDDRLTVYADRRRSFEVVGPPCFTNSRGLALRRGRNVPPPQVLFPGSFDTTF